MPISLKELQQGTRTLAVEYEGESVNVTYRPGALTPAYIEAVQGKPLQEQVCDLVTAWDVLDEKGKPLPVTLELANALPLPFLAAVTEAINGDLRPNGRRAAT